MSGEGEGQVGDGAGTPARGWSLRGAPLSTAALVVAGAASLVFWTTGSHPPAWMEVFWQPAFEVWRGAWWVLATSVFLHADFLHLIFNGYWMVHLAAPAERLVGTPRAALFGLAAAVFSSGLEMLCADEVGIGLSGVVYAVLGFAWRRSRTDPAWAAAAPRDRVVLFLGWFVLCVALTLVGFWNVANFAHLGGLLAGLAIARATEPGTRRALKVGLLGGPALAAALLLAAGTPWSASREAGRALDAVDERDAARAIPLLERASALGFERGWCLSHLSWAYLAARRPDDHARAMDELSRLDPEVHRQLVAHYAGSPGSPR